MSSRLSCLRAAVALALLIAAVLLSGPLSATYRGWRRERAAWQAARERYPVVTPSEAGEGGPAAAVRLQDPMGIGEDAHGNVFVTDRGRLVWRFGPSGRAVVVAGTGRLGRPSIGEPARDSDLGSPEGLCVGPDASVYFADSLNHMVLRIRPDGRLERVAGSGRRGAAGDGGPAREAELARPFDVRLDSRGNLYIADHGNHRIRRVSPYGVINTVAGTGDPGYSGDGGAATQARLNGAYGVAIDEADQLWIADSGNNVLRRVTSDGIIETIVGTGEAGYGGDGGSARHARFDSPQCLVAAPDGTVYVCDEHNHAVRAIDPNGLVSTLAGTGKPGRASDGALATKAALNDPENLWLRRDGSLLVADGDNGQVRRIDPDGRIRTFAGAPRGLAPGTLGSVGSFALPREKRRSPPALTSSPRAAVRPRPSGRPRRR